MYVATAGMPGAATTNCGVIDNGAIEVSFAQADLLAASSATDYTATMAIQVEPIKTELPSVVPQGSKEPFFLPSKKCNIDHHWGELPPCPQS